MVDAEIELVEHPGRRGVAEQRERAVDQVVVIEHAAPHLGRAIALDHFMRDGERARGCGRGIRRRAAVSSRAQMRALLLLQSLHPAGMRVADRLGGETFARLHLLGAEDRQIMHRAARVPAQPRASRSLSAGPDRSCRRSRSTAARSGHSASAMPRFRQDPRVDRSRRFRDASTPSACDNSAIAPSTEPVRATHSRDLVASPDRLADHVAEGLVGGGADRGVERRAERRFGIGGAFQHHVERRASPASAAAVASSSTSKPAPTSASNGN